jgi:hypothetical protein
MTMTNCFIQWDNQSYKLNNNSSEFSIQNLPGLPFKITWDNNSEHIINNPDNYSYQIIGNFTWNYTGIFRDGRFSWSCYAYFSPPLGQSFSGAYYQIGEVTNWNCIPSGDVKDVSVYNSSNQVIGIYQFRVSDGIVLVSSSNTKIKITDNNIVYEYPITNINSVQIINSIGGNKIIIEGQEFDILDVNSARKYCDDNCPNGTIECGCNGKKCCYEKVFYGYKLVKVI